LRPWFTHGLPYFCFSQIEVPWPLGPPDGRYLVRDGAGADDDQAPASHVLLFATLGAPARRRLARRRRTAPPEPPPVPVATGRATIISVASPFEDPESADGWLSGAGEEQLEQDLLVLARALHAFRLVTADPYRHAVKRDQVLVARVGYGEGEEVAEGRWRDARELVIRERRGRRARVLEPQARLAAVLGRRDRSLICEELTLRARFDLDRGAPREAALQLRLALEAALAELPTGSQADTLAGRIDQLRGQQEAVGAAARAALTRDLSDPEVAVVAFTLGRLEAALRARALGTM
jgi:hypothetical protein